MEPEESLSDWTLAIVHEGVDKEGIRNQADFYHVFYHVYKPILAVGSRKSYYFANLFRDGGRFAENEEKSSRITLHKLAANAFPAMLDYMYG